MGGNYISDPAIFVIDTLFSVYIFTVLLRFLLQWTRADFYNPISQFVVKITHPPLKLLRRVVPSIGRIDTSCLVFALLLQMTATYSMLAIQGLTTSFVGLALISVADLVQLLMNIYYYSIFATIILSWVAGGSYSAASSILYSITEPLLSICRSVIPNLGGLDLSPMLALFLLHLAKMMVLPPLHQLASLLG